MERATRSVTFKIGREENADLLALLHADVVRRGFGKPCVSRVLRRLIRQAAEALRKQLSPPAADPPAGKA